MKRVVMVVAPQQFRDEEYEHPREVLRARGAEVVTASTHAGECIGRFGAKAQADAAIGEVDPEEFDAVLFVGGAGSAVYFDDERAHELARSIAQRGGVVAAICIAPSTLAHAGLLRGRRATAYPTQKDDLVAHGATWSDGPVEVDGRIITANGPDAARAFGEAVADALGL
ncbi:DJ-1/PfpI family protein [Coriobacteriia bacterium Es71-Z0120]|uniref:DJ-1/PfpI family protein n=1 Tax=Parvivirga hydrogeniphila TaxID=2939460 RepID=UPI002260C593|nr:DJ-1/PfpI family protein [Parvivirga hydrogeniphila]MCL4079703.1 DJ-1/PfpI family protein [Parvivirga hydrogeniphila]